MTKIIKLDQYKNSKKNRKKYEVILKDLKEIRKIMSDYIIKLYGQKKYVPVKTVLDVTIFNRKLIEDYIKMYEKILEKEI